MAWAWAAWWGGMMLAAALWAWPAGARAEALPPPFTAELPLTPAERRWLDEHPVIQVGVSTEFPPYYFADAQGRYEGFVIDLMQRLSQRVGLRMEYRRYGSFEHTLQALQRGEIDLTPFAAESPARRELMRFSKPMFSTQLVLVADRRLADLSVDEQFSGYRIAVETGSTAAELLRVRYPRATLLEYDTSEAAVLAAASGNADVFVGFRQVAVYYMEKHLTANLVLRGGIAAPGTALGPAVRRDNVELAGILDKAIDELTIEEITAVAGKWLPRTVVGNAPRGQIPLTDAQRAWVQTHHSLRVGFDANFAPIAFANQAGGFDGLAAELMRLVARKAGLIVSVEEGASFAEVYARAKKGELDVLVGAARNVERSRDFDFVGPFLRVPTVIVAASEQDLDAGLDAPGHRRLALLKQHFLAPLIRSRHPNLTLQEYDSQSAALNAVRRGEADLAIGNMKVVNALLEREHAGALRTVGIVPQGESELYFAVRNTLPEMAGVLRAGLDAVTPAEMNEIEARWLRVQWTSGVPWTRVLALGAGGLALAALVIGSLWHANRRLRWAHATLEKAKAVADEQVAARAAFIAYLSHELRGSLGGLSAGLGLLQEGGIQPDRHQPLLGAMAASSQGLLALCERTLDFERMLQGGVDLQPATTRLADLIEAAVAPWRLQAEVKGLALHTRLAMAPDGEVVCDPVRLTQVLQNIVGNAVKFTERGQVEVLARDLPGTAGLSMLEIEVRDTGPGIAPADLPGLFNAFSQGAAGRGRGGGAGLGLSISLRIVEAMGGRLQLQSSSAEGSCFSIELPLPRPQTPGGGPEPTASGPGSAQSGFPPTAGAANAGRRQGA